MSGVPSLILVPVDLAPCSLRALVYAGVLAKSFGAQLEVVYVWEAPVRPADDPTADVPPGAEDSPSQRLEADLTRFIAAAELPSFVAVSHRVLFGDAKKRIVEAAVDGGHELVVLGTHGRTGLERWLLGSVAEWVVRHSDIPVLVVPQDREQEAISLSENLPVIPI